MPSIKIEHPVIFYHEGTSYYRRIDIKSDEEKEPLRKTITLGSKTLYVKVILRESDFVEDVQSKTKFMVKLEIWETDDKSFLASLTLDDRLDLEIEKTSLKTKNALHFRLFSITEDKHSIKFLYNESGRTIWKICDCERLREKETYTRENLLPKEIERTSPFRYNFEVNLNYYVKSSDIFSVEKVKLHYFKPPPGNPDFKIICEDDQVLRFHKAYLSKISEPFKRMIENTSTRESSRNEVKLKDVSFKTLKSFHLILYGKPDSLNPEDLTTDLMIFADMYDIQFIYDYIKQSQTPEVTEESLIKLSRLAQSKNDKYLEEAIFDFVKKNPGKLEHLEEWDEFLTANPDFSTKFFKRFAFSKE